MYERRNAVQVVMNVSRKSTVGWSIENVLLDFSGGLLSVAQLLLQCAVKSDFTQILGNPVKFGLGFVSLLFDIVFMVQHYMVYANGTSGMVPVGDGLSQEAEGASEHMAGTGLLAGDEEDGRGVRRHEGDWEQDQS
jgi:hypothetical protein